VKNKNKLKLAYNPKIMQELLDQPGVRENVAQMKPETLEWFKESLVKTGVYAAYVKERKANARV
jgi:recombinational DNA repair protein RecT